MKFNEWLNYVKSQNGVDTDGYYGKQCMDLYNHYCTNVIETQGNMGADYAKNLLSNSNVSKYFKVVKNYGDYIPPKGAVALWQGFSYGHVAIVLEANLMSFKSIDQNWTGRRELSEVTHNYTSGTPLYFLEPYNRKNIDDECPFLVKITADALNIRTGPGTNYSIASGEPHCIRDKGIYTIVEKQGNWGKLKSGAGWICLDYTERK